MTDILLERDAALREVAQRLGEARRILALCHIQPDGDAIGSLLGLGWILGALPHPPEVVLACADGVPQTLRFLPGWESIVSHPPPGEWDAVVSLDASDAERLGPSFDLAAWRDRTVVIDHHVTNLRFGALNLVDTAAAATAQIIVELAAALGAALSPAAAECLLTGIITDTLSFRTSNTTPEVMRAAATLMEAGANAAAIADQALFRRPLSVLRLWGLALSSLHMEEGVLWVTVTPEMRARAGVSPSENGSLVSQLASVAEARVAAAFSDMGDGRVEVSLRSRPGHDVASIALHLGGGGHPQAAGCTVPGPLEAAVARILPLLFAAARST